MSPAERLQRDRFDAAFGDWVRRRLAEQKPDRWTQQRLRDELGQRGYEVKREWLNQVIGGKHASDDLRRAIEHLLGEFPEPAEVSPVSADLASAIREQADAIRALVDRLPIRSTRPQPTRAIVAPAPTVRKRRTHWLKLARARRGWSPSEVDRKLERPRGTYSAWETGKTDPHGAEIRKLAEALDVPEWMIAEPPDTDEERLAARHFGDESTGLQEAM